jgi:hypothetical protein
MSNVLLLVVLLLTTGTTLYVVRSLRIIGSKVTEVLAQGRTIEKKLAQTQKSLHNDSAQILGKLNLLNLEIPGMKERDFNFVLSMTSHPARFDALAQALPELKKQVLQPTEIVVNIARGDMGQLPQSIRDLATKGEIVLNECNDLGPGKKLIPTLKMYPGVPIIAIDDDPSLSRCDHRLPRPSSHLRSGWLFRALFSLGEGLR